MSRRVLRILLPALVIFVFISGRNWLKQQERDRRMTCITQRAAIEGAKEQYAIEHVGKAPESFASLIPHYLRAMPKCPAGGEYELGDHQVNVTCTIPDHHSAE